MREKRDGSAPTLPPQESPSASQSLKADSIADLSRLTSRQTEHALMRAVIFGRLDGETLTLLDESDVAAAHDISDAGDTIARLARLGEHYELGRTGTSAGLYRRAAS